jgi:hypothetical protein
MTMRERYLRHFGMDHEPTSSLAVSHMLAIESFAEAEVSRALAPREPSPALATAEKRLRRPDGPWYESDRDVISSELDRLRAELAAMRGEAQRTVWVSSIDAEGAIKQVRYMHWFDSPAAFDGVDLDGNGVYAVTLVARRCEEPRK